MGVLWNRDISEEISRYHMDEVQYAFIYMTNELVVCLLVRIFCLFLFLNSVWLCVSYCKDCDAKKQGDSAWKMGIRFTGHWRVPFDGKFIKFHQLGSYVLWCFFSKSLWWNHSRKISNDQNQWFVFFGSSSFLFDTFFWYNDLCSIGFIFSSPPKKKQKSPFWKKIPRGPETSPSPRAKKKTSLRGGRGLAEGVHEKEERRNSQGVGFSMGHKPGMDSADGGSSMRLPRYRTSK